MKIFKLLTLLSIVGLLGAPCLNKNTQTDIQTKPLILKQEALGFDGTYNVPLKTDLKMKDEVFNHTAIVEKQGENVYMTFTQDDSKDMTDMKLLLPGNIGTMVFEEGIKKSYVYSLQESDLYNAFPFSVFIPIMSKTVTFNMTLLMDQASFVGDTIRDLGERPARYLPTINVNVNDLELEKGTTYFLPEATANILDSEIEVEKKVEYVAPEGNENIEIIDNKVVLDKIGIYKVTYIAESDLYKTSLGNNTRSEVSFTIKSKVGASMLAKFEDINNIVDDSARLQANMITSGETYDKVVDKMKNLNENYEIFNLEMFLENGEKVTLDGDIKIYLKADQYFDRNKVKIASFDDEGNLINYEVSNYGRYIALTSNKLGVYVVYVEGITFHMPIWGYVLIGVGAALIVGGGILTIILVKRKNKKTANK